MDVENLVTNVALQNLADNYYEDHIPELEELEKRLLHEVDDDLFEDPKEFKKTLPRVIDVLGAQLHDSGGNQAHDSYKNNVAMTGLNRQLTVVQYTMDIVAKHYCKGLNDSVVAVGKIAREFSEAVALVKGLRSQVNEIQVSLNPTLKKEANPNEGVNGSTSAMLHQTTKTNSLRELYLKKLECEAVLSLLDNVMIVRDAPSRFDELVQPSSGGCRIITAAYVIVNAKDTMCSGDLAQVPSVMKVMDQLMIRMEKAEEIVWATLNDVIFLRTGNSIQPGVLSRVRVMVPGFYRRSMNEDERSYDTGSKSESDDETEFTEEPSMYQYD